MTASQRQALEDVRDYNDPWHSVKGSQHGAWPRLMAVLTRHKWCRYDTRQRCWLLTRAGARALVQGA